VNGSSEGGRHRRVGTRKRKVNSRQAKTIKKLK